MIEEMIKKLHEECEEWNRNNTCDICGVNDGKLNNRSYSHEECRMKREEDAIKSRDLKDHEEWIKKTTEKHESYAAFCGVSIRHSVCTIQNFIGDCSDALSWINKTSGENLLIQSERSGNGKTHLAIAIMKRWGQLSPFPKKRRPLFVQFFDMMMFIKKSFDGNSEGVSEESAIRFFSEVDLLVIDDIGSEKISEYSASILYSILNNRYCSMLPTIVTTNESATILTEKYGSRIVSRIASGVIQKVDGKDNRITKHIEHNLPDSKIIPKTIYDRFNGWRS